MVGFVVALNGRDLVALVLAVGVTATIVVYVVAVVWRGYVPSGDALSGAVVGAVLAVLARYVLDRRENGHRSP